MYVQQAQPQVIYGGQQPYYNNGGMSTGAAVSMNVGMPPSQMAPQWAPGLLEES